MQTTGSFELGYASRAILGALMEQLIASNHLSASAASDVLAKAVVSLNSCGNLVWVPCVWQFCHDGVGGKPLGPWRMTP
jgi:hypothetical protein